jgi:uncharacterized membrane protein
MNAAIRSLMGIGLTAMATYFLDPASGRRRRALLADRLTSLRTDLRDGVGVATRDLAYRARGLGAQARARVRRDDADDEVLSERVRSALGRAVTHLGAVTVEAQQGHVTLSGDVLASEHEQLLQAVHAVRGVRDVSDQLAVHRGPESIPALQGGRVRRPRRSELMQENWSPAIRMLTGVAGGALLVSGFRARGVLSLLFGAAGGALLLRSSTNMPLRRLAGAQGRRGIDVHKTINVAAPVQRVFSLLDAYENFPAFMRNVREVRPHGDGRSHWVVAGPAGTSVEWDSVTTVRRPNEILAWRTVPNSTVAHAGIIRLRPDDRGGTQLDIQMSYNPPAGALGHVVARLFGADPKTELDEDLMRMKSFLESGKPARDAAAEHARTPANATPGSESSRT